MDPDKAGTLAAELGKAGLVRVGGGHSVWLTEAGRQACKRPVEIRPSCLTNEVASTVLICVESHGAGTSFSAGKPT